jgi:RNA polymerase sigma-70 factor (ECF subfamily)
MHTTPATLLERLRQPDDAEAWSRFVRLYTTLLYYWARRCGLQTEDAADLVQDVFATLYEKLPEFTYVRHKSFRAWLRTVTLNRLRDRPKRVATRALPGDDAALGELEAPDELSLLQEDEYRRHLVSRALSIMRADFQPSTWRAFWEHGVVGRAAEEVARDLGLSVAGVYGAKFRVLARLRQELGGLLD